MKSSKSTAVGMVAILLLYVCEDMGKERDTAGLFSVVHYHRARISAQIILYPLKYFHGLN